MCGEVWPGHSSPDTDVYGALTDASEATRPVTTGNAPGAQPSTGAQQARQETRTDESSVGARDPVAESTPGEAARQGEP